MLRVSKILVATDFSESARRSREHAERFARVMGAELHLLHVSDKAKKEALASAELHDVDAFRLYLDPDARLPIPPDAPPLVVEAAFRQARTASEGILDYAREHSIDLIMMGTAGRSGLGRMVLGSTAETVVRAARCPVATVRSDLDRARVGNPQRIVAAVDFGASTETTLAYARALGAQSGAQVDLFYALEEPAAFRMFSVDSFRAMTPRMVMAARRKLEDAFSAVAGPRVSVRYHVAIGDAAEVISGYAQTQRADLLLMGLRADSPERTLIGSTLERVMRSAPCPVLTMRSAARSLVAAPRLARVLEAASAAPSAFA